MRDGGTPNDCAGPVVERVMVSERIIEAPNPKSGDWKFSDVTSSGHDPSLFNTRVSNKSGFQIDVEGGVFRDGTLIRKVSFHFPSMAEWRSAGAFFKMTGEGAAVEPEVGFMLLHSDWIGTDDEFRVIAEALRAFVINESRGAVDFKTIIVH